MAKITLIDDSSATLDLLTAILQREGHTVQTLSSGVGAEAKLSEDTPNLVLLDVVMPLTTRSNSSRSKQPRTPRF